LNKEMKRESEALKKKDVCINCSHEHFLYYGEGEFALEYCDEHEMILDDEKGMDSMKHTCDSFERG